MRNKQKTGGYLETLWSVILTILILTTITMGIFSFLNKNKADMVETKIFSEIPGFSFEYPVFKGWEVAGTKKVNEDEYVITFDHPISIMFEAPPTMIIKKDYREEKRLADSFLKNKNKVLYDRVFSNSSGEVVSFYGSSYVIDISPFMHEGDGYSGKAFESKIIETFKFDTSSKQMVTSQAEYQKVSLQDIESQKEKLNGKKVEYTGILKSSFETLDGKIWLKDSEDTIYLPNIKEFPGMLSGYYFAKVKVYGTLMTEKEGYGHNGIGKYQIGADKMELLEKLPECRSNLMLCWLQRTMMEIYRLIVS